MPLEGYGGGGGGGAITTDAAHGNRGGGALHAAATVGVAGFQSAAHFGRVEKRLADAPAAPATAGAVRLGNGEAIYARDAANSADASLLALDASDVHQLGDDATVAGIDLRAKASSKLRWYVAGALVWLADHVSLRFAEGVAGILGSAPCTSDAAPSVLTIQATAPYASATGANRTPGAIRFDMGTPSNGGSAESQIEHYWGGSLQYKVARSYSTVTFQHSDTSSGLFELYAGSVIVSASSLALKDTSQVERGKITIASSVITYGATATNSTARLQGTQACELSAPYTEVTGQLCSAPNAVNYASSVTLDLNQSNHHEIGTLTGACAVSVSNVRPGAVYTIEVTQDGSGSRAVTWSASFKFATGDDAADGTAGARTVWAFRARSDSTLSCVSVKRGLPT